MSFTSFLLTSIWSLKRGLVLTCLLLLIATTMYASGAYAEDYEGSSNVGKNIRVVVDTLNISVIPIQGMRLVYLRSTGSLSDDFTPQIKKLQKLLVSRGLPVDNIAIIFLDYYDEKPPLKDPYSTRPEIGSSDDKFADSFLNNQGLTIHKNIFGLKNFSTPFLVAKREILIGTLIPNGITPSSTKGGLHVVPFNFSDSRGYLYQPKEYYDKIAALQDEEALKAHDKEANGVPSNDDTSSNPPAVKIKGLKYLPEEIIKQRVNILKFANLGVFAQTPLLGIMEYYDVPSNTYSYFVLPGKADNLA